MKYGLQFLLQLHFAFILPAFITYYQVHQNFKNTRIYLGTAGGVAWKNDSPRQNYSFKIYSIKEKLWRASRVPFETGFGWGVLLTTKNDCSPWNWRWLIILQSYYYHLMPCWSPYVSLLISFTKVYGLLASVTWCLKEESRLPFWILFKSVLTFYGRLFWTFLKLLLKILTWWYSNGEKLQSMGRTFSLFWYDSLRIIACGLTSMGHPALRGRISANLMKNSI